MTTVVAAFVGIAVYVFSLFILIPLFNRLDGAFTLLAFCWPPLLALGILAADEAHRLLFSGRDPLIKRSTVLLLAIAAGIAFTTAFLWSRWVPS
jgi:hypothetical protein